MAQLRILLITILAMLGPSLTKKQRRSLAITESSLQLRKAVQEEKREIGASKHHHRGRATVKFRMTAERKAALRKAIHANGRMSRTAKRKALAKLK